MLNIIICLVLLGAGVFAADENPCVEPGVNRDPSDNASFIICSEVGKSTDVTKIVHCPAGYIFSHEDRTCVEEGRKPHHRVSRATSVLCKSPGPICASCDLLVVCVEINDKLVPLTNVSCSATGSNNTCDAKKQACTDHNENSACHPATSTSTFQCIQPGFFPDPYDCKKYHICSDSLDHYEASCDNQYDPVQATCQDNSTCTNPTRKSCVTDASPTALSSYPSFYSVCIPSVAPSATGGVQIIYKTGVLQCSENKQFNDATSSCEFVCKTRPDRFPDPTDCHSYYDCPNVQDTSAAPVKKTCPQDLAYDSAKKICALESKVSSCQSITTRAVTETTTTTTAAPTTRTTTAAPTTRATTAPSTTTRRVEECTENSTRPDNSSRYRYFQCQGGRYVQKQCPAFSRYNTLYNSCVYSLF
ncbi:mucin-5AC [Anabrus simplex]|uniref:mucin-5AC n=1 Tax=Anabrus simplex TaxID=316456 RepID=UPI0035A32D48